MAVKVEKISLTLCRIPCLLSPVGGGEETGKRILCMSSKGIILCALWGAVSLVRTSLSWIIGIIVRELYRIVLRSAKMNDERMSTLLALTRGHVVIKECLWVKIELSIGK